MAGDAEYTGRTVDRFLKPVVGVFLVLVLAAVPAATVVCQLACAGGAGAAHADHAAHGHSAVASQAESHQHDTLLRTSAPGCDHLMIGAEALLASAPTKIAPPAATHIAATPLQNASARRPAAVDVAHSPPAARPAPLPLRI